MTSGSSKQLRPQLECSTPTHNVQALVISRLHPDSGIESKEEILECGDQPQHGPSLSGSIMHVPCDEDKEAVITSIRATDVAASLRRLPAGFYTAVQHSGREWRTENKPVSANNDVVEWGGLILVPSDLSATICLGIYASFEFQSMVCNGEQLRKLTITVEQVLERSARDVPFTLFPDDGDVVFPCSSFSVTVKRWKRESSDSSTSRVLDPYCSTTQLLEEATNHGHIALSRYWEHRGKRDLERSIKHFEHALNICSLDHPCRAAAQSNMAMAKFIRCQVDHTDPSLEVPLSLYRNALAARPAGHLDRPYTLIQLAAVLLARFDKRKNGFDTAQAKTLLHEAMNLGSAESHQNRTALFLLQLYTGRKIGPVRTSGQSPMEASPSGSINKDLGSFGAQLLRRFERFGDLDDLQQAISLLETSVQSTSVLNHRYLTGLTNLGVGLFCRFRHLGELSDLEQAISKQKHSVDLTHDGNPDKPGRLNNLANSFSARFQRLGELIDLEQAISAHRDAVDFTPDDHPDKPGYLSDLGNSFLTRFGRLGDLSDLEQAILTHRNAMDLTPDDRPNKPHGLNNLGNSLSARFERLGQLSDLEQAIARYRDAVDLTPDGHPDKPRRLNNLGTSFLIRFRRLGELSDLEQAMSWHRNAVDLTPDGHPDGPARLNNLANSFLARFERLGKLSDLEQAIFRYRDSVDLTPDGHPDKPGRLNNLGASLRTRFRRLGEPSDLEQAILRHRDAIDLIPDGHPDKPTCLDNLGSAYRIRFQHLGMVSDLEQAISRHRDAVDLTPNGHIDKTRRLSNLGTSFLTRFTRLGDLSDLDQAISMYRDAVSLIPDSHPHRTGRLNNLGNSLFARFERLGELSDLEQAISMYRDAVDLTPDGHPDKPGHLNNLANSILTRFECLGKLSDLAEAISSHRDAVDLVPDGRPDKPTHIDSLGNAFLIRFEHLDELSDLDQAISRYKDAVELIPDGHPNKPGRLSNLGNSFRARFKHLGQLSDLEQAIVRHKDAVDLTPDGHPNKTPYLSNLGNSFLTRFKRLGEFSDLKQAISTHRDAVDLTPDGHPDKPGYLNNLAISFLTRFEFLGEPSDLEQAILRYKDTVGLTPDGHPDKPGQLNNLGATYLTRFKRIGGLSDLEQAISRYRDAVDLIPDGHPDKAICLDGLGNAFQTRFQHLGELNDLEHAISRHRDAIELTPDGYPDKAWRLSNLGNSFLTRFGRLGDLSDLEQAISTHRNAMDLTPDGHPDQPGCMNNLGICFRTRYERLGELSNLQQAILRHGNAVELTPDGHPDKPGYLNNLGTSFLTRFEHLGEPSDIEQAILRHGDAVDLIPDGHPDKPICLDNLGSSFGTRFRHLGELNDLEQAISRHRGAADLTPDGHPSKTGYLNNLGNSFRARFEHLGELSDLEQAISLYSHAACDSIGPTTIRFRASQRWISCARVVRHHSLLHAYSVAIGLLPQLAWTGLSLTQRYQELVRGADVGREAAAAALDSGDPQTAVEWLEQGRSIIWAELFQLRSSYEELSSVHPDDARRLRQLSTALEHASVTREKSLSSLSVQTRSAEHRAAESLEQTADRHRMLAIERDKLLQEIRGLPGFERFLVHKEFTQLRTSAHSGPVVILNAAESRCDALIVLADVDHVIHVPLPNFTLERSKGLQNMLKNLLGPTRVIPGDERVGKLATRGRISWESLLSTLWKGVVKPVLDSLDFSTPGDLRRVFWCPTGPFTFLPIHAAGLYGTHSSEPGQKLSDFVVSSYVPTLSILTPSPKADAAPSEDLHLLTVRQPPSDGQSPLPGVDPELRDIRAVIQNSPSARTTLMESSVGTVEEVLSLMKDADWVHFACHGIQDSTIPTDSGLCLADRRRLRLSDIIALSRPRGGLAFLSACETATGDKDLSDEAIHIAAGMLFAGYGGVVGTMWSISDRLAPRVAKDVYGQLFRNGTRPDYREAARALQDAVGRLRDTSKASFVEWLPFIHVGL